MDKETFKNLIINNDEFAYSVAIEFGIAKGHECESAEECEYDFIEALGALDKYIANEENFDKLYHSYCKK